MKVIGLCGGSGSGKSTVSEAFATQGILPINTDEIYHTITEKRTECTNALESEFGREIINPDGSLNRKVLARIVFSDTEKLKRLNKIAHFHVLRRVREIIKDTDESKYFAVIVDAPLLFESGFDAECDAVIAVISTESNRIERIVKRDGISYAEAKQRLSNQLSDEYLKERVDYVIYNDGGLEKLYAQVSCIVSKLKNN